MVHDYALLSQRKLDVRISRADDSRDRVRHQAPTRREDVAMPGATASTTPFGSLESP